MRPEHRTELEDMAGFCDWVGLSTLHVLIRHCYNGDSTSLLEAYWSAVTAAETAALYDPEAWAVLRHIASTLNDVWCAAIAPPPPLAKTEPELSMFDADRDNREEVA